MKYMCLTDVILGIKITRTLEGLILSQSYNKDKILERLFKNDYGTVRISLDTSLYLSKE